MILDDKVKEVITKYLVFMEDLLSIDECNYLMVTNVSKNAGLAKSIPEERRVLFAFDKANNLVECLIIITHELRHQYQYDCVHNKEMTEFEEPKTIKEWKYNLDNYIPLEQKGYDFQPLELDADAFAHHIMRVVFGIELDKVKNNIDKYRDRYIEIASEFIVDDINDSLEFSGFIDEIKYVLDDVNSSQFIN